jgi:Zn-dependent M32 family carboxypeptidase
MKSNQSMESSSSADANKLGKIGNLLNFIPNITPFAEENTKLLNKNHVTLEDFSKKIETVLNKLVENPNYIKFAMEIIDKYEMEPSLFRNKLSSKINYALSNENPSNQVQVSGKRGSEGENKLNELGRKRSKSFDLKK